MQRQRGRLRWVQPCVYLRGRKSWALWQMEAGEWKCSSAVSGESCMHWLQCYQASAAGKTAAKLHWLQPGGPWCAVLMIWWIADGQIAQTNWVSSPSLSELRTALPGAMHLVTFLTWQEKYMKAEKSEMILANWQFLCVWKGVIFLKYERNYMKKILLSSLNSIHLLHMKDFECLER